LVGSLYYSPFYLNPLLMVISGGLEVLYLYLCRKCINHIHLLYFLHLLSFSHMWPPLSMTCFYSCSSLCRCLCVHCSVRFLPWYFTCKCIMLKST
jgi:hypothetical protein